MASGITELVGELSGERWRSREAGSDFVIAEALVKNPVSTDGEEISIVVKGNAPIGEFIPGLTYRFGGRWDDDRVDPRTGQVEKQFKFTHYTKAEPHSRYGLVSYLAKFAPGIGPVIAGRLFDAFGSDAVKVLREFPKKCVEMTSNCEGRMLLTLEKAEIASAALKSMGKMEDTKIELVGIFHGRGFPHTLTDACVKVWGVLAPMRVARDPFSLLVRRLPGCGFARCDRLYNDLGLPPGRLKRQMLCLWHSLRTDNAGHTWFPAEHCKRTLEQSVSGVKVNFVRAVNLGLRSRWLAKRVDAAGVLWLAEFTKAENEATVAERLAALLGDPPTMTPFTSEISKATAERVSQIEDRKQERSNESRSNDHEDDRIEDRAHGSGSEDTQVNASEPMQRQREHDGKHGSIDAVERPGLRRQPWQFSSQRMTVLVVESSGEIVEAAPVVRKFVGQPLFNLEMWMRRQGGFERRRLNVGEQPETHNERMARRGRETGICQFCSRELTHPTSREMGYGPTCAKLFGLPWVGVKDIGEETADFIESEAAHA